jgi:pyruvate dehydrogenase E2 component (dihydrolipoamide acetyltransferase)
MSLIDITIPDIGGFADVPVIEILVAPGDTIAKDAPLITLESDKATMEVPSTIAGTVRDIKVKVGDKVSEGVAIISVETTDTVAAPAAPTAPAPAAPAAPEAASAAGGVDRSAAEQSGAESRTAPVRELIVPDIGGFTGVAIVSVFVKNGDVIEKDAPLVELESEKATMEVPAIYAGRIRDVKVRVGDKVSQGDVLAIVET